MSERMWLDPRARSWVRTHQESAPVEGEAQEELWPISDALHERVRKHEAQTRCAHQATEIVQLQQHCEACC
jgi:hypothetical protein